MAYCRKQSLHDLLSRFLPPYRTEQFKPIVWLYEYSDKFSALVSIPQTD
jgi:hypothetical protein